MNSKLTIKDSSLAFTFGFLACQLGAVIAMMLSLIIYNLINSTSATFELFMNTGIGYLITSFGLYFSMLIVFFYFNHKKENKITEKIKTSKLFKYLGIAILSFVTLYPIVTCFDSLLVKIGFPLSSIPYSLTTQNYFISLLSLVIFPAVCEELLFRGIIFSGLKKHGKTFSIFISAIMFCLFHMSISQTIYPLLMGLLLGVIMHKENNIYYCILVHTTNNFLSLTLSYFKISLIFQHWTYILLAIILAILFISVLLYFILHNNTQQKEKLTKNSKLLLSLSLAIMLLFWTLSNLI